MTATLQQAPLSAEDQAAFQADGFLIIERFIDEVTLAGLRRAYDEVLRAPSGEVDGDRMLGGITRQVMMPSRHHAAFAANDAIDRARALVEPILDRPTFWFDMLIFKPAGHLHETPWHQDMAYAGFPAAPAGAPILLESVQFWIPLDDVDADNGCMHFVPGCHTQPLLEHDVVSGSPHDPDRLLAIVDPECQLDLRTAVAAPLAAGGATLHGYGTPHFTPANTSQDRPRRAYIFNLMSERLAVSMTNSPSGET